MGGEVRGIKGFKTFLELLPHWGRRGVNWVMGRPLYVDVDGVIFQYNGGICMGSGPGGQGIVHVDEGHSDNADPCGIRAVKCAELSLLLKRI